MAASVTNSESETLTPISEACLSSSHPFEPTVALETITDACAGIISQDKMPYCDRFGAGVKLEGSTSKDLPHTDSLHLYPNKKRTPYEMSPTQRKRVHCFSPIPLEADTFCDFCITPIYGFGWGPVCQRCAVCHMTIHWDCKDSVRIGCQPISQSKPCDQPRDKSPDTLNPTKITQDTSHTLENGVQDNLKLLEPTINKITNTHDELSLETGLDPPTARLSRHSTDVGWLKRPKRDKLVARHSFFAGQSYGAPLSSRLSYEFSSLDKEAIRANNIHVRDWSPSVIHPTITEQSSAAPAAPNSPPQPPQRVSSLAKTSSSPEGQPVTVSPIPHSSSSSCSSTGAGSSSSGLAIVIQTTECFVRGRPKQKFQRTTFHPAPSVPMVYTTVGPRNTLPWGEGELEKRIEIFNTNEFGLQASKPSTISAGDCAGQVRIHINLLRPINMLLTNRPTSIFDVVGNNDGGQTAGAELAEFRNELSATENLVPDAGRACLRPSSVSDGNTYYSPPKSAVTAAPVDFEQSSPTIKRRKKHQMTSKSTQFWVPRGSTKVLHVLLSTTARCVISALLERFQIKDNPQKFALYEHTIEGDQEVSVRKLFDNESPLGLLLCWVEPGVSDFNQTLSVKRLVLQENETGDIVWTNFSLSELKTFLGILNQEEAAYRNRIEAKYERRRKKLLRLIAQTEDRSNPCYVMPDELESTWAEEVAIVKQTNDNPSPVEQEEEGDSATAEFMPNADGTLKPQTDFVSISTIDVGAENCQVETASPLPSAIPSPAQQSERANREEVIRDGLQQLTLVDQAVDYQVKLSKRDLQLQAKQQKKAEKERLKAEKAVKQRTHGPFRGFSWFGHSATLNPSSKPESRRKS